MCEAGQASCWDANSDFVPDKLGSVQKQPFLIMKTSLLTLAALSGVDAFTFDLSSIIKQLPASAFNHSLPANR